MTHLLVVLLVPLLVTGVVTVGIAKARTKKALVTLVAIYFLINGVAATAYAWISMPNARRDDLDGVAVVALVLVARCIDWWALGFGRLIRLKWTST